VGLKPPAGGGDAPAQQLPSLRTLRLGLPDWVAPLPENTTCGRAPGAGFPYAALREQFRARLGAAPGDVVVLFVGSVVEAKGVGELAAAWQRFDDETRAAGVPGATHLAAVGKLVENDPAAEALLAAAAAAGGRAARVHAIGETDSVEELVGWFAAADAQVVNSRCENFGRVTVEGMAHSLPVLGTACGGTLEILQHGATGLLHPPPGSAGSGESGTYCSCRSRAATPTPSGSIPQPIASCACAACPARFNQLLSLLRPTAPAEDALVENLKQVDRRTPGGAAYAETLGAAACARARAEFAPHRAPLEFERLLLEVHANVSLDAQHAHKGPTSAAAPLHRPMKWQFRPAPSSGRASIESTTFQVGNRLFLWAGYGGQNEVVFRDLLAYKVDSRAWVPHGMQQVRPEPCDACSVPSRVLSPPGRFFDSELICAAAAR
jgi:hypothetical protein